ncbi:MAG: hypothetical protein H7175_28280, partial [Burkholderiales bacterium]|nr:hypothetical protein [Anaerolineae bacterium]
MTDNSHSPVDKKAVRKQEVPVPNTEAPEVEYDQTSTTAALQHVTAAVPPPIRPNDVLALQRSIGNQAVMRMMNRRSATSATTPANVQRAEEDDIQTSRSTQPQFVGKWLPRHELLDGVRHSDSAVHDTAHISGSESAPEKSAIQRASMSISSSPSNNVQRAFFRSRRQPILDTLTQMGGIRADHDAVKDYLFGEMIGINSKSGRFDVVILMADYYAGSLLEAAKEAYSLKEGATGERIDEKLAKRKKPTGGAPAVEEAKPLEEAKEEAKADAEEDGPGMFSLELDRAGMEKSIASALNLSKEHEQVQGLIALATTALGDVQAVAGQVRDAVNEVNALMEAAKSGASSSGESKGSASATSTFSAKSRATAKSFNDGIDAYFKLKAALEVRARGDARVTASYGPLLAAIEVNALAYAKIAANASGSLKLDMVNGLRAKLAATAGAEARVAVSGKASISLGQLASIDVAVKGAAFAKAKTSGSLVLNAGPDGIAFDGKFEAIAGAGVKVKGKTTVNFAGTHSLGASAGALVGVGFSVAGGFSIEGGKLSLSVELAAALGLGFTASINIEIEYKKILEAIGRQVEAKYASIRDWYIANVMGYEHIVDPADI